MRASTFCLCVGLAALLVGLRVALMHTPEPNCHAVDEPRPEWTTVGGEKVRAIGTTLVYEMTGPGAQAWLPILGGGALVGVGALLRFLTFRRRRRGPPWIPMVR